MFEMPGWLVPIVRFVNMSDEPADEPAAACLERRFRLRTAAAVELDVAVQGQGPPLLLLHGFPDNRDLWRPLVPALSTQHRLWMPDLRGYRLSDKPTRVADYAIEPLLADVLALADAATDGTTSDATQGRRVALAGHDWGGMLAWAFAAVFPERVSQLVIFNAPHPCRFAELLRSDPAQRVATSYVQRLATPGAEDSLAAEGHARLRALMRHSLPGMPAAELDALAAGWAVPGALTAMLNWYRALGTLDGAHAVPGLGTEAPTLLLWGEQDGSFVPANLHGLQDWVPQLQVQRFADAGHWLLREQPAQAAAVMINFLAAN
jgi:epoxide hydrolase 4